MLSIHFVANLAEASGAASPVGVDFYKARNKLRYLAIRNRDNQLNFDSIARFRNLSLIWIEMPPDAPITMPEYMDLRGDLRASLINAFKRARGSHACMSRPLAKFPHIVFLEMLDFDLAQ